MSRDFKADFPIFTHQPELVYLDSAATSQKPQAVIAAMTDFYSQANAPVHRGVYDLSQQATEAFELTRAKVARFIGANDPSEIIFTSGTTMGINLVVYGWARQQLQCGDIIVLSEMEHHSNIVPWQRLRDELGVELFFLPLGDDSRLDYQAVNGLNMNRVKLLALTQASNVLGTINPVAEIATWFKQQGAEAKLLVDAAQSAPHLALNVEALGADFVAFSAHKMFGPAGVGVLYARRELLAEMEPLLIGSHMISSVSQTTAEWAAAPAKFEPGTPNMEGVIGLGVALDYLTDIGWPAIAAHEQELSAYALKQLQAEANVKLFGPADTTDRLGIFSFAITGLHAHDVAEILNRQHVAVRAGHHCAQPLMERLGVSGTVRASLQLYNATADVDILLKGIQQVKQVFGV